MKILYVSYYGDSADIAFRIGLSGDKVQLYIRDPKYAVNYDGIVPKCTDWRKGLIWADLIFFDDNKCTDIWEVAHKMKPCFNGSSFGAKLENDRKFGQSICKRVGLNTVESLTFKTAQEVIKHLKEHNDAAHVVKPQGHKVESHHVMIGEEPDNSDLIMLVERFSELGIPTESIEVEERKFGVETGVSVYFDGDRVVGPIELDHEHKRSNERETGYLTGEMGTLMKFLEDDSLPIYQETLAKVIPILRANDYRGQVNLNMIVDRESTQDNLIAWPLEFTPRMGKPAAFISCEMQISSWGEIAWACATKSHLNFKAHYDWAVGVVMAGFGFPFEDKGRDISQGLPIRGLDEHVLEHWHPMQVRYEKGKFKVGYGEGYIGVATGRGKTIEQAKSNAYAAMSPVKVPNAFFRHDISDKISPWRLHDLGILPMEESCGS